MPTGSAAETPAGVARSAPSTDTSTGALASRPLHAVPLHGGRAARVVGPQGPVHLWIPRGYARATAATIVYVHGYFVDADGAVRGHRLFEAFARSRRNAVFVVPEAPASRREEVYAPALGPLVRAACADVRLAVPDGPWLAVGHSGAYRTLLRWLDEPRLDAIVLLDAAYGDVAPFTAWARGPERRLVVVSAVTRERSRALVAAFPRARTVEAWPSRPLPRGSAVVHAETALDHATLVEDPEVLGALLARLPVPPVGSAPDPQ